LVLSKNNILGHFHFSERCEYPNSYLDWNITFLFINY